MMAAMSVAIISGCAEGDDSGDTMDAPPSPGNDAAQSADGSGDGHLADQSVLDSGAVDGSTFVLDMALQADVEIVRDASLDAISSRMDAQVDMGHESTELVPRRVESLPLIYDVSGAPAAHVDTLVKRALSGLGLPAETGPSSQDRVFVNRWYIAWIDETGFYGKMNGLWTLNGSVAGLDFTLLDGVRPVNSLVVGEFGRGGWPAGYKGAEHIEFPNAVPEADDDPQCAQPGSFCAQYSLNEALPFTDPDIPAWRACNPDVPRFSEHFSPIQITANTQGLRIMYEGPLTKEGDFGGSETGANCHGEFLFEDGIRRRVYLRVGYEFRADVASIDRLLQIRNPSTNPPFSGPFGFIGGFVFSKFPEPHPLKRLHRYARPSERDVTIRWDGVETRLNGQDWNRLPSTTPTRDVVLGWAGQAVGLSPVDYDAFGAAFEISNQGPNENGDTGFCLCVVHGGIEMGGGLNVGVVPGGATSQVSVRRLTVQRGSTLPERLNRVYEAETDLSHGLGRLDGDGWSANVSDESGHLIYGPYATDFGEGLIDVVFRMMIDVVNDTEEEVVTIDVFDATAGESLVSRPVTRRQFIAPFRYEDFSLGVDLTGRAGHQIETRVFWHDISYVRVDRITVLGR